MTDDKKKKGNKRRKVNWSGYNESLVKRSEVMFSTDFENWRNGRRWTGKGGGTKFDVGSPLGLVHQDMHNPHASFGDLVAHLWQWSPLGTLSLGYAIYRFLK